MARIAIAEALDEALQGLDTFDINAIDAHALEVATLAFVAEMVFVWLMGDPGQSLANAPNPAMAVQREADIRALVHEVTQLVGHRELQAIQARGGLTQAEIQGLIPRLANEVQAEMKTW